MIQKPAYGEACNSCGMCCILQQCPLSTALFGEAERCPAIETDGSAHTCGLVRNTADYVPDVTAWGGEALTETFALLLGAGIGCDGQDASDDPLLVMAARPRMHRRAEELLAAASPQARELVAYFRAPA